MAYIINRFSGEQLLSLEDGTVDNTTDLKLIGKNYSGYGEALNENFLFLLESFAGSTSPSKALSGQVWFDSSTNKLKYYTGTTWKTAGGAEVSSSQPAGLVEGDLWYNSNTNQLFARTSANEFILVGPQAAGSGTTQLLSTNVASAPSDVTVPVIIALIDNNPVYMISDAAFTPSSSQPASLDDYDIPGHFPVVKKGITLIRTPSTGITGVDDDTVLPYFWGSASNALKFDGLDSSEFIRSAGAGTAVNFQDDAGIKIGDSLDFQVHVTNGNEATLSNLIGDEIKFQTYTSGTGLLEIARFTNGTNIALIPGIDNAYTIGTSSARWNTVHATTFNGTATKASALVVDGVDRTGSINADADTVAVRDANGNLVANIFTGTATRARYADLAEKYTTAEELPAGTAVAVCGHPGHEVEPAKASDMCIGVVSTDPAVMMNSDADGQYIGLKGRLPVRVKGPIAKGQAVYAWEDGVCGTIQTTALVGVALESNDSEDEKLVECVLKT